MGKKRNKRNQFAKPEVYDSDDERAYAKEKQPDPGMRSFYNDEVDDFHEDREKILLEKGAALHHREEESSEEEVLGFSSDSDDGKIEEFEKRLKVFKNLGHHDAEVDSDDEEEEKQETSKEKSWGGLKTKYYGADDHYKGGDISDSEADQALLEEQEALAAQKRLTDGLDEDDFGLHMFQDVRLSDSKTQKEGEVLEEKIETDLSKLPKAEQLKLFQKDSPEFIPLVTDYKEKMAELQNKLFPLLLFIRKEKLAASRGAQYIETKVKLILNYCVNVTFYVMLKAKRAEVKTHPVLKRLLEYRDMFKHMSMLDERLAGEVTQIEDNMKGLHLKPEAATEQVMTYSVKKRKLIEEKIEEKTAVDATDTERKTKRKKDDEGRYMTQDEKEAFEYYKMMKAGRCVDSEDEAESLDADLEQRNEEEVEGSDLDLETADGKRAITYQMEKNKGLAPKRKKEQRNARVKYRNKYRKAKIRRKGQVRQVTTELHKYGGEMSGIRTNMKRSIQLK